MKHNPFSVHVVLIQMKQHPPIKYTVFYLSVHVSSNMNLQTAEQMMSDLYCIKAVGVCAI